MAEESWLRSPCCGIVAEEPWLSHLGWDLMAEDAWLRSLGAQLVSLAASWPKQPARSKKVPKTYGNIDVLGRDRHFRCRGAKVGVRNSAFL